MYMIVHTSSGMMFRLSSPWFLLFFGRFVCVKKKEKNNKYKRIYYAERTFLFVFDFSTVISLSIRPIRVEWLPPRSSIVSSNRHRRLSTSSLETTSRSHELPRKGRKTHFIPEEFEERPIFRLIQKIKTIHIHVYKIKDQDRVYRYSTYNRQVYWYTQRIFRTLQFWNLRCCTDKRNLLNLNI